MPLTITEALAEIKTIGKRIDKKREFIQSYLFRQEGLKDPLEKDGGSVEAINRELQSVFDLEGRIVRLRRGIQHANDSTIVTIGDTTMSIGDWLTWRRDVAPNIQRFHQTTRARLNALREQAKRGGVAVVGAVVSVPQDAKPTDYIVNINEAELARKSEEMEEILGVLDGQLSLKNATVMIDE